MFCGWRWASMTKIETNVTIVGFTVEWLSASFVIGHHGLASDPIVKELRERVARRANSRR